MLQNVSLWIFLLLFCYTSLNDRLRENKAQHFLYKKSWVKLMLFGFSARNGFLRQFIFWQENFITIFLLSNKSVLLLKVLKGLACWKLSGLFFIQTTLNYSLRNSDFQSQFSMSKIIGIFLKKIFIEEFSLLTFFENYNL